MEKYVFLYKENNTDDRDCVKYINIREINKLQCGHYFSGIGLNGACFSCGLNIDEIDFDNITTILTKEDFMLLNNYNNEIHNLGYGLDKQPEKIELAHKYFEDIKHIIDKLQSKENENLFEQVKEEEKEYIMNEYNISSEDVDYIFDNYYLDYKDRAIISCIYDDYTDLGEQEFDNCCSIERRFEKYINYEQFGEDLCSESDWYLELNDGRIVCLNY